MIDNNLKFCREELEMTQSELGYVFGISKYTVSGWEIGKDTITLNKLYELSNYYKISIDYTI